MQKNFMPMNIELALPRPAPISLRSAAFRLWRRLLGRMRRLLRWEFWPPCVFYPPVIAYIAYLGIRFRSLTLFTAANPGIPGGGFVGESKHAILQQLRKADWALPRSILLRRGRARIERAETFMEECGLHFPVVLKPDAGQRGAGVAIVQSSRQLREYLLDAEFPVILQEHFAGKEFGVFYVRYPGEAQGRIFSVTEKLMPVVVGDGRRTLEDLILADDRTVCMAGFYLHHNAKVKHEVPRTGENFQLVEIGTHCRGAIFLDGSYTITAALQHSIRQIAESFDGFYFGRFDIRVPSVEDFMAGRNLKVVELNGVTSEATHIYDPKFTLLDAYRILFEQWRIAFEVGHQNRATGVQPSSLSELFRMTRQYSRLAQRYPQ